MNRSIAMLALAVLAAVVPVHAADPNAAGLRWGDGRPLGGGTARVWAAVDVDGSTQSVGVSLDEAAVFSNPGSGPDEVVLPLPAGVALAGVPESAASRPAFRVRYDPVSRGYLVMLEGLPAVSSPPGTLARGR